MFLLVVCLSYLLGCISVIVLVVCLCLCYGVHAPGTIFEEEQFQIAKLLPKDDRAKNSTVDALNCLLHLLFQEMKDRSSFRRFIMNRLQIEIDELKEKVVGQLFLEDIIILSFTPGKQAPIFSDIQHLSVEHDERQLIKKFVARIHAIYTDGFACTLDIKLVYGVQCQVYIKVKHIQGYLRFEMRREPYSHWVTVFQNKPLVDLEVRAYLFAREVPLLAKIIKKRIMYTIQCRQIWPNYKVRRIPFFPKSRKSVPIELRSIKTDKILSGVLELSIDNCDRLSLPFGLIDEDSKSSLLIFFTCNIDKHRCEDYLCMNRNDWKKVEIEFIPKRHTMNIKEVLYMDRSECLIETLEPLPDGIQDSTILRSALEDKNVYLMQIQGKEFQTFKKLSSFLKSCSMNEQRIKIVVGIPLLHSIQLPYNIQFNDQNAMHTTGNGLFTTVRQRLTVNANHSKNHLAQQHIFNEAKPRDKQENSSLDTTTVIMVTADDVSKLFPVHTSTKTIEPYIKFNHECRFHIHPDDQYFNLCLWCKLPSNGNIPSINKKLMLLGYTSVACSEMIIEAHMNFKRETSMKLNLESVYTAKPNFKYIQTESERQLAELTTHRRYDDNLAHGCVTINIKHKPTFELRLDQEEKSEASNNDKEDLESSLGSNREQKSFTTSATSHIFQDYTFSAATLCAHCNKKIWTKSGRRCRNCSISLHKKCENQFDNEHICTSERDRSDSRVPIEEYSIVTDEELDLTSTVLPKPVTTVSRIESTLEAAASAAIDFVDSTTARPIYGLLNKQLSFSTSSILSNGNLLKNTLNSSLSSTDQETLTNLPTHVSSTIRNACVNTYNKLLAIKSAPSLVTLALEPRTKRALSDLNAHEDIPEDDIQDIISQCLFGEKIDVKSIENLLHEKAVDHMVLYEKVKRFGAELFAELPLEERKLKFECEISRLKEELELQDKIRDELIVEYNSETNDENIKKRIEEKIADVGEKVQALAALTIFYLAGLKHCYSQLQTNPPIIFDDKHYRI